MRATNSAVSMPFVILLFVTAVSLTPANAQDNVNPYQKWLSEDVRWIITEQERADFEHLSDNAQRDHFVVAFWERRNPMPEASENTFKEEHYHRLAYANQHFAAGIPGWKTDRGRFYIMFGPPNKIVRHQHSNSALGTLHDFDSEEWHWSYIDGIGCDVVLVFADTCECSEYHLTGGGNGASQQMIAPWSHRTGSDCLIDKILLP